MGKQNRNYRYYSYIMAAFVTVLLCSNFIGSPKVAQVGPLSLGAGVFFFPISYFFGDVLTEVYGYAQSRRVIWAGFAALIFASLMTWFVVAIPPAAGWENQRAYELVLGGTPRIAGASIIAFVIGEFCNSFVLAKMKIKTQGRYLWLRAIASTAIGEAVDTSIIMPLGFYGSMPSSLLLKVAITNYIIKVSWEVLATPLTYLVVDFLKRAEHEDYYDINTDFSPFRLHAD
jgi:uncharacterized integral membrane protein (TIGR00697 family)